MQIYQRRRENYPISLSKVNNFLTKQHPNKLNSIRTNSKANKYTRTDLLYKGIAKLRIGNRQNQIHPKGKFIKQRAFIEYFRKENFCK